MKPRSASTAILLFVLAASGGVVAQSTKDIAGTWQAVTNVHTAADGKKTDAFGSNPKGMAIFTADGHFAIINVRPDLPKFISSNRSIGSAEENRAVVQGSLGLFGTYSVVDKTLVLKIEASTYPNWSGSEQRFNLISFGGDELKWTLTASDGGHGEVTWKRYGK